MSHPVGIIEGPTLEVDVLGFDFWVEAAVGGLVSAAMALIIQPGGGGPAQVLDEGSPEPTGAARDTYQGSARSSNAREHGSDEDVWVWALLLAGAVGIYIANRDQIARVLVLFLAGSLAYWGTTTLLLRRSPHRLRGWRRRAWFATVLSLLAGFVLIVLMVRPGVVFSRYSGLYDAISLDGYVGAAETYGWGVVVTLPLFQFAGVAYLLLVLFMCWVVMVNTQSLLKMLTTEPGTRRARAWAWLYGSSSGRARASARTGQSVGHWRRLTLGIWAAAIVSLALASGAPTALIERLVVMQSVRLSEFTAPATEPTDRPT